MAIHLTSLHRRDDGAEGMTRRVLKLPCPHCGEWQSLVKDCRPLPRGFRRVRLCVHCDQHFSTTERVDQTQDPRLKRKRNIDTPHI